MATEYRKHTPIATGQQNNISEFSVNGFRIFQLTQESNSKEKTHTGREKIAHRVLQSQHQVGPLQAHCWPPTSMWQGCIPP
jgi:hypothetical protein